MRIAFSRYRRVECGYFEERRLAGTSDITLKRSRHAVRPEVSKDPLNHTIRPDPSTLQYLGAQDWVRLRAYRRTT